MVTAPGDGIAPAVLLSLPASGTTAAAAAAAARQLIILQHQLLSLAARHALDGLRGRGRKGGGRSEGR